MLLVDHSQKPLESLVFLNRSSGELHVEGFCCRFRTGVGSSMDMKILVASIRFVAEQRMPLPRN